MLLSSKQNTVRKQRGQLTENRTVTPTINEHMAQVLRESQSDPVINKWKTVLAKCPEIPRHKMALMARLFENQHNAWQPGNNRSLLTEDMTTTNNIADFTRFALPLLRKSFSRLIADNLVGVQPMSQPASLIFYIRYKYAMSKGQTVAGTQIMRQNPANAFSRNNGWALDPYYSSQEVRGETASSVTATVVTHTLAHNPVLAGTVVVEIFENAAAADPNCDDAIPCGRIGFGPDGLPDAIVTGTCTSMGAFTIDTTTPNATKFDHTTGQVKVTLATGTLAGSPVARVSYEYDLEGNPFQPEITMSIDSDSVSASTRKLKTTWTLEAAQDFKSIHNIDPETLLTDLMADEMVAEIDRELINDLIVAAAVRATHNFSTAAGSSVNFTDRNIALLYKTLEIANIIHRTTLRGPANFMVTSSDLCSKYEQLNDFRMSDALGQEGGEVGITNAGSIQNKIKVYKDPLFPNCKVLLGYKGASALDTGLVYAPYVGIVSTPTILDPGSYSPTKGIMTRYGKVLLEDGSYFYGVLNVTNL